MATSHIQIDLPPDRVFAVLATPATYADWVVGSDMIRGQDENWPAVGSRFYHRVGVGPFKVEDHTEVVEVDPPRKLVIHARARPVGTALVTMHLEPRDGATYVTMIEEGGDPLSRLSINPLTDWLVKKRNDLALRRLKRITETGMVIPDKL
ncbi:MAG: SRPBCC domain-containing protein [Actinomycetota bacterium]|nr:SRPBCC domain-containing protein [Actinomycetota bacterium]